MKIYKISQMSQNQGFTLKEMFPEISKRNYKIDHIENPDQINIQLKLYRGMDINLDKFDNEITLSPNKSEQQSIWFSRNYEDAKGRGKYILEYPLDAIKHIQTIHFVDGNTSERIPEHINDLTNPYKDCKYYAGIELPDGWFWSYKTEKYIVCKIPIVVKKEMFSIDTFGV